MASSLFGLGLFERAWEDRIQPSIRGVGLFDVHNYDPGAWKPYSPGYVPFLFADHRDMFWGAKILMRFTPAQIRAVVELGRFTDPRAVDYITTTLIARQRKTALHWFERTSPLDRVTIVGERLCFDDLTIAYDLAAVARDTRYAVTSYDRRAVRVAGTAHAPGPRGRTCAPLVLARDPDGYTIVKLVTERRGRDATLYVHIARSSPTAPPRVIGIWRD